MGTLASLGASSSDVERKTFETTTIGEKGKKLTGAAGSFVQGNPLASKESRAAAKASAIKEHDAEKRKSAAQIVRDDDEAPPIAEDDAKEGEEEIFEEPPEDEEVLEE